MRKSLVILLLSFFIRIDAHSQPAGDRFSPAQLLTELDSVHAWLIQTHPKLYANTDSAASEKKWAIARKSLRTEMTRAEFQKFLSPLVHQYNDGHTFVDIEFDGPAFAEFQKKNSRLFPFEIKIIGGQLVVVADWNAKAQLAPGSVIETINNINASTIITSLLTRIPGDYMAARETSIARLFSFLLWNYYEWDKEFSVTYKSGSKTLAKTIEGIDKDTYFKNLFPSDNWTIQIHETEKLAVIECRSYGGGTERAAKKMDSLLAIVRDKKIQHLALDLRRNGGGNSYIGDLFLSHVTHKPFAAIRSKSFRDSPALNALPADHWLMKQFTNAKKTWQHNENYYYQEFDSGTAPALKDSSLFFKGKFYLLTSYRTFSSAHMTALQVKCANLGTIIGEPTGEQLDLTGEIIEMVLPHTGIVVVCPTAMYTAACHPGKIMGVQPDHFVAPAIADIITGKDVVIAFLKKSLK